MIRQVSFLDIVKGFHIHLENLKLHANIGTENPALTAFLVAFISGFFATHKKLLHEWLDCSRRTALQTGYSRRSWSYPRVPESGK